MLDWMDGTFVQSADRGRFAAFASIAAKELKFDPNKLSRQDAAKRLAQRKGKWNSVWTRFASSTGYDGIIQLLNAEEPADLLADKSPFPKINTNDERQLRDALTKLDKCSRADAAAQIALLEQSHAWRRGTVWARRGEAPLAHALYFLVQVVAAKPLAVYDGGALAESYVSHGAAIDWAAMRALALVPREVDRVAVAAALKAIYLPWIEDAACALQELVRSGKAVLADTGSSYDSKTSTIVFVDGLRMDLAHELVRLIADQGVGIKLRWCWSGFPTVTATCKPLVSPVARSLSGATSTTDVLPLAPDGRPATKAVLFKLMNAEGWNTDGNFPPDGLAWTETGRFDDEGHALGARLAERLVSGIRDCVDHIVALVRAGRHVRIVTDHGWLLMPGGLPTARLDVGLVEPQGKRSRCAMVKSGATTGYLQIPWTWNRDVFVATATGARCFFAGQEYAHGGISPQECVLPVIEVAASGMVADVSITQARWEGLRLRIEVSGAADNRIDVRLGSETGGPSVIKGGRVLDETGRTSVLVSDEYERKAVCLVVLDDSDLVRAHRTLIVGGE